MTKNFLYRILNNRAYLGEAVHKDTSYPGEHTALIEHGLWDKVHAILQESPASVRPGPAPEHRPFSRDSSTDPTVLPSRRPTPGGATSSTATM